MSHIARTSEEIKNISYHLDTLRNGGYSKKNINEILESIIPINEQYQIKPEINGTGHAAYFNGYHGIIHINEYMLKDYVQKMLEQVMILYSNLEKVKNELRIYLIMFVLVHEVEHGYQYLIGQEYMETPYELVKDAYKNLYEFNFKNKYPSIWLSILIERYKQQKDKTTFVLERNANVEAYQLLNELSKYENEQEIQKFMNNQYLWYSACGYLNLKNNGSFEEAYRNIWRHRQYKSFDFTETIPVEDRIRYGLPLEAEPRIKLLEKFLETKENNQKR